MLRYVLLMSKKTSQDVWTSTDTALSALSALPVLKAEMLLPILLLNLVLCLTDSGADAKSSPEPGSEGLENLVEKLESRLRDMEKRLEETEQNNQEMKRRLEEFAEKMRTEKDEFEKREQGTKTSRSKLKMEVEEALRKEFASNFSHNNALTKPSLRDLPIVIISAWRASSLTSPQTVTFESFLANFNNQDRPGGGGGVLNLDSGVFTCFTPGYYTVSFSAYAAVGPNSNVNPHLYMYKNGSELPESYWFFGANDDVGVTSSRILVRTLLYNVCMKVINCKITIFPDSPHGCRRHSGAEDDERRLHPCNHLQH